MLRISLEMSIQFHSFVGIWWVGGDLDIIKLMPVGGSGEFPRSLVGNWLTGDGNEFMKDFLSTLI
jgi:hypothetical protein